MLERKSKAELLNNHFCSIFSSNNCVTVPKINNFSSYTMNSFVITPYDVFISISKLKDSLSRTPEQIPATYIKNTSRSLSKPLSMLYNQILSNAEIPKIWKHAIVNPIFKSGKKILF